MYIISIRNISYNINIYKNLLDFFGFYKMFIYIC